MRSRRTITDADRAQIIAWTAEGVTARVQAERLGMAYSNFVLMRQLMAKAGLVQISKAPAGRRRWTKQELARLDQLLERGTSYDQIAKKLNRTRTSVLLQCRRRGARLLTVGGVYTARQVAETLGVPCPNTVGYWIRLGWLPATNGGRPGRPLWRVQMEDLWAFMERDDYWMAWRPERIPDSALREWAQELRAGKPAWLTPGQVAQRLGVGHPAVNDWIHRGLLPSIRYGNHWVREDALVGFVPPCERPRQRRRAA